MLLFLVISIVSHAVHAGYVWAGELVSCHTSVMDLLQVQVFDSHSDRLLGFIP